VEQLQAGDPRQIGGYRLLGRLGSGGMGRVFLGKSPGGRDVAVKVIRAELADSPDFRARFAHEVAAARRVSGFFTAPVVDADPSAPQPWLVTGYVDGPSLADAVADRGPLDAEAVLALARGLAEGLAPIHAAAVVHRDLKPSNVLLAADGPRIIDFGISRAADAMSMTDTGAVVGSPGFMSPEQADGRAVGPASDVFSLGSVLAFAATGREPFGTGEASVLLYRVVQTPPALAGLPDRLRPVIEWCLSKDPAQRPAPGELLTQLSGTQLSGADATTWSASPSDPGLAEVQPRGSAAVSPAYLPTEAGRPAGRRPADDERGFATDPTAAHASWTSADFDRHGRQKKWAWAAAAAVLLAGTGTGLALASHHSGTTPPADSPSVSVSASAALLEAQPQAVVEAYFAAINAHDWPRVWQLGGDNIAKNRGKTYASMVAGYHDTSHDVLTSIITHGNSVSVRVRAYETNGAIQTYVGIYTVARGIITDGHLGLLGTQNAGSAPAG
jgi:serine/threonine protein kinase